MYQRLIEATLKVSKKRPNLCRIVLSVSRQVGDYEQGGIDLTCTLGTQVALELFGEMFLGEEVRKHVLVHGIPWQELTSWIILNPWLQVWSVEFFEGLEEDVSSWP